MSPREKISENTRIPVALTARERELILEHTFAGDELLAPVQALPEVGRHAAEYTLYDIEELQGFVAAEANHTDDRRLEEELSALHERLQREMEKYDDGNWQTSPEVIE
jgi:hypothetical protein